MKHTLASLVLMGACLAAMAQPASPEIQRDRRGFLPVPGPTNSRPANLTVSPPSIPVSRPAVVAPAAPKVADPVISAPTSNPPPAESPAPDSPSPGTYVLDDKHKLFPGDRVGFQIVEDRTNSIPLLVAESAELDVPYLGRVSVAGKTCKQAAADIKAMLEKDYYFKATVVIGLDALTKVVGKVYVFGPVRNPGPVEIPTNENFTAGKAILRVGGFGDFANRKKVQIVRKTATGNKTFTVNMENVLEKGRTEEDITLEAEDFIIVPQRAINW